MRIIVLPVLALISGISLANEQSPYAGEELRPLKSFSSQEIESLRSGQGMGFAKLAELNHYPGPKHVLELADDLELTPFQVAETEALFEEMRINAVALGEELLEAGPGTISRYNLPSLNMEQGRCLGVQLVILSPSLVGLLFGGLRLGSRARLWLMLQRGFTGLELIQFSNRLIDCYLQFSVARESASLIFAPIYLALSIRIDPTAVYMLPALMTIWCTGRLVFWAGYRHSLNARVIGMDWTTVTTMVAAVWFIATYF